MSASPVVSPPTAEQVTAALARVNDPEIQRPITELGMVKSVDVGRHGKVRVEVYLTVAGCPLAKPSPRTSPRPWPPYPGVSAVDVHLDVMSDEQRRELQGRLAAAGPSGPSRSPSPPR